MTDAFNCEMLILARQVRKVSQEELAQRISGLTQGKLSKIERGRIFPDQSLIQKFADELNVKSSFLADSSYRRAPAVSFHRKRRKLSVRDLESVHGKAEIYRLNLRKLLSSLDLETDFPRPPAIDPEQFGKNIGKISDVVRQRWASPRGPIRSLTTLIEKSGVIIIPFDFGSPLIDGFSQHEGDGLPPVIFLNTVLSADRQRFSLAHELGHLVMHHSPSPDQEIQANHFASSLLMPKRDIENEFNTPSIQRFMDLKLHWGVSIQALIYRAWELGKLSDRMFKYYNIEVSKRGWKTKEPIEISGFDENAKTLRSVVSAHLNDLDYDADSLSDLFGLNLSEFVSMYPLPATRPKLRVVR